VTNPRSADPPQPGRGTFDDTGPFAIEQFGPSRGFAFLVSALVEGVIAQFPSLPQQVGALTAIRIHAFLGPQPPFGIRDAHFHKRSVRKLSFTQGDVLRLHYQCNILATFCCPSHWARGWFGFAILVASFFAGAKPAFRGASRHCHKPAAPSGLYRLRQTLSYRPSSSNFFSCRRHDEYFGVHGCITPLPFTPRSSVRCPIAMRR
jgi:hypothetical protein